MIDEISGIKERLGKLEARIAAMDLKQSLGERRPIQLTDAICSACKKPCKIPFVPTTDRPIFCKECWQARKGGR
ncbi:hypothetical protein ES703_51406 [subsurface metagenome]